MNTSLQNAPGIDLTLEKLMNLITGIACWISEVALILIVVAIVYYGIMFLISRGDPGKVGDARKALTWGVVGIIVILGTYSIIASIGNAVTEGNYDFVPLDCPN